MGVTALRKAAPGPAPVSKAAEQPRSAFRRLPSIPISPALSDHDPPPIRLCRDETAAQPINLSSLAVSSPHDSAEKEASSTAAKIVRMPSRADSTTYLSTATNTVFRLVNPARDHEPLQIKERGSALARSALTIPLIARSASQATIQRQTSKTARTGARVAANIHRSMSGGEPLPIGVRQFMEPRFGADFGNVRIH